MQSQSSYSYHHHHHHHFHPSPGNQRTPNVRPGGFPQPLSSHHYSYSSSYHAPLTKPPPRREGKVAGIGYPPPPPHAFPPYPYHHPSPPSLPPHQRGSASHPPPPPAPPRSFEQESQTPQNPPFPMRSHDTPHLPPPPHENTYPNHHVSSLDNSSSHRGRPASRRRGHGNSNSGRGNGGGWGNHRRGRWGAYRKQKSFVGGTLESQREWEKKTACCFFLENSCRFGTLCRFAHCEDRVPGMDCQFGEKCQKGHFTGAKEEEVHRQEVPTTAEA